MKYRLSSTVAILLFCTIITPLEVVAQTTPTIAPRTSPNVTYNPVSSSDTKKTFSGTSFSSVGGAIAGCANAGGTIVNGAAKLFNKLKKSSTDTVPVNDPNANRRENCLNGIAYSIAKNLLQQVSNKTLNWINKGLGGNPLYVQDIGSNLRTIRDEQLGRYLGSVQSSNPIFGNAIRSAVTKQVTGISDGYIGVAMNTPEAQKYNSFQQDFTSGGWGSLLNMNNNPIGALFNSTNTVSKNIATEQQARVNEVQRNDGFLDMRTCVEYAPVLDSKTENEIRARFGYAANTTPTTPQCLKYKTVTPGALISQQASSVLNSPQKQLEMADSINEVLGSFFDQLLNNLYQKGLAGLQTRGSVSNSFGSAGNNIVLGSNGLPLSTGTGNAFGYQSVSTGYDVQDFDISRPQQLRAIMQAQYNFQNKATDSKIAMDSIVPTLGALDYCIPGPNPTWRDGLADNYQTFLGSFETPTADRTFLGKFLGAATSGTIQAILGLFGGGGTTKELPYALVGQPSLTDKVAGDSKVISPWSYLYYTKDYDRGVKNTNGDEVRVFVDDGYNRVIKKYETNFTEKNIIDLFKSTAPDPTYAEGAIKNALKETTKLASYYQTLSSTDADYEQALSDNEDALLELESIRKEELAIIKVAKARYIKERADAGNPVDMACINAAYVVDESDIIGLPRQESDTPNPMIQASQDASDYFYSHL